MEAATQIQDDNKLSLVNVLRLLDIVRPHNPIVVGGQALCIWAEFFRGRNPTLDELGPITSVDLDFLYNKNAATALARELENGVLRLPSPDDQTPSAALVTGKLGGQNVVVDFMRSVKGVKHDVIERQAVTIGDPSDTAGTSISVLHPLDCLRSRLANINALRRSDEHTVTQAQAAVLIIDCFVDHQLAQSTPDAHKSALSVLRELEYVLRDMHIGKHTHKIFGHRIEPLLILNKYMGDCRIDERFRENILGKIIHRIRKL